MEKLLEDMEKTIKEVKELLATFRALQLEHERFTVQSQEFAILEPLAMPVLERSDIPDSPTKFAEALEFTEPKKRGRKKKIQA